MYPTSPTPSYFKSINVITKKYEIDKQYIKEDFYSKENEEKRNQYFKKISKQQTTEYREENTEIMYRDYQNILGKIEILNIDIFAQPNAIYIYILCVCFDDSCFFSAKIWCKNC